MKAQINKSQLMKRAWNIYRGNNPYSYSFSAALTRAWEVEKANIVYEAKKAEEAESKRLTSKATSTIDFNNNVAWGNMVSNYYQNAPRGTYFGD